MKKSYHTKNKDLIMDYLDLHKEERISASSIYEAIKEKNASINLATVYRNLDKLHNEGILRKFKTAEADCSYYQYVHQNCRYHLHLQCTHCGKIIHLECDFMDTIMNHLLKDHGFALDCENSTLSGLCEECRKELKYV